MTQKIAEELLRHNKEFLKKAPKSLLEKAKELAKKGQHPPYVLITCSDSRVDTEALEKSLLGEAFEIRTAGHVLDKASIESVKYAVEHLGVKDIVIMGHTHCGAVTEALKGPAPSYLVETIRSHIGNEQDLTKAIVKHSLGTAMDLIKESFIQQNEVTLHVMLYDIETMQLKPVLSFTVYNPIKDIDDKGLVPPVVESP